MLSGILFLVICAEIVIWALKEFVAEKSLVTKDGGRISESLSGIIGFVDLLSFNISWPLSMSLISYNISNEPEFAFGTQFIFKSL